MNTAPIFSVEVARLMGAARLQRAVIQACGALAHWGEPAYQHESARQAVSRVSRVIAYGAPDAVVAEAVEGLQKEADLLALRLDAIKARAIARCNAIGAALDTVNQSSLARTNGWGSAGTCPATPDAKTPAAQAVVSRVAAGSAAATVLLTPPTCGLGRRIEGGGIGQ